MTLVVRNILTSPFILLALAIAASSAVGGVVALVLS